ncbi:MAG TPA: tripartite tricarboxylate transporter substrate binding protein [Burkholderiales bacterium]|nr:tripartite tricarboxylate transporter substrate binding protein [Burkholderiales bacterium]
MKMRKPFNARARAPSLGIAALMLATVSMPLFAADAAHNYPVRPVRIITGSPGSTADITARFIGQKLSERFKQQMVIDNRASAGGIVGAEIVANAPPDGYTLYVSGVNTQVSAPLLFKNISFDPLKDFAPVSLITNSGLVVTVVPALNVNNLKEFVALAKSRQYGLHYASASIGTSSHLTGELFAQMLGITLVHVPYKGAGFTITALLTGEVQAAFLSTTTTSGQIRAGKLKAIALLNDKRFAGAPEIPTALEQGFKGLESYVWFGLYAPGKTPRAIIDKLNREIGSILKLPETRDMMLAQGAEVVYTTPEEFDRFQRAEIVKWGKVIRDAKIQAH